MQTNKRTTAAIGAGIACALLLGVGVGWLARGGEVSTLEERVGSLEAEASGTSAQQAIEPTAATLPAAEEVPTAESPEAGAQPESVSEQQIGLVTSIANGADGWVLRIDYVQFLTGAEAERAAAARGQEPLDYFIINDNPKIREFPVRSGIAVTVVTNADGSSDPAGHPLSLAEWAGAMTGPHAAIFGANLYWVTITDGVVTAIEAQYLP